jgi:hypothetical protein
MSNLDNDTVLRDCNIQDCFSAKYRCNTSNMQISEEAKQQQRAKPRQLSISVSHQPINLPTSTLRKKELCVIGIDSAVPSKDQHEFEK